MTARVIPAERRGAILTKLQTGGVVRADVLAEEFGVSAETVRRDLLVLEQDGIVRRVYGGAVALDVHTSEAPFALRSAEKLDQKAAISRAVAAIVSPTDTLFLDVGTSVAAIPHQLAPDFRGLVVTNSLLVAEALNERADVETVVAGGRLRFGDLACSGPHTLEIVRNYYLDKAFLGSGGVHPEVGLTDYHLDELAVRREIIAHAKQSYVLADSSKLGQIALGRVCPLNALTAVITDADADPEIVEAIRAGGTHVVVAPNTES